MILSHRIQLDPNNRQRTYFARACGVARLVPLMQFVWLQEYRARPVGSRMDLRRLWCGP